MAVLSSHFLNGVDGTHAAKVGVTLVAIAADGTRTPIFASASDDAGRFAEDVVPDNKTADTQYEMVIASGAYFAGRDVPMTGMTILREIVIRFTMPNPEARYHIPVIMSPNSYSCWWSS